MLDVTLIRPPIGYKDWNTLYQSKGRDVLRGYIEKNEQPCYMDIIKLLEREHP